MALAEAWRGGLSPVTQQLIATRRSSSIAPCDPSEICMQQDKPNVLMQRSKVDSQICH